MPKYLSDFSVIVLLVVLSTPGFAQQAEEKYEIPAPLQPAPEIPDLSQNSETQLVPGKTFSILDQNAVAPSLPGKGTDDSGTFATTKQQRQDSSSGFGGPTGFPPTTNNNSPANSSPALSPNLRNELRQPPQDTNPPAALSPLRNTFGDSRLPYDQAPNPPQPEGLREDPSARPPIANERPFNFPNERNRFDRSTGNTSPPVNQVPTGNVRQLGQTPLTGGNQIQPVEYQEATPQDMNRERVDMTLAKELMDRYSVDQAPDPLPGQPTKLGDLLQRTSPSNRLAAVSQYWKTHQDWALLLNAAEQLNWLNQFPVPQSQSDRILLNTARSVAENQILEAEIQLSESQATLQRIAQIKQSELLPLPADKPLLQPFNTHYDYYSQHESLPSILKSIDNSLPRTLQLISNRAQTARMATSALNQNRTAFSNNQTNLASVLEAARIWRESEEQLIQTVTRYNIGTALYATNFRPSQPNENLVAMLIAKPNPIVESSSVLSRTADASLLNNARSTNQAQFSDPTGREGFDNRNRNPVNLGPLPNTSSPQNTNIGAPNRSPDTRGSDNSFGAPNNNRTSTPPNPNGFGFGN